MPAEYEYPDSLDTLTGQDCSQNEATSLIRQSKNVRFSLKNPEETMRERVVSSLD